MKQDLISSIKERFDSTRRELISFEDFLVNVNPEYIFKNIFNVVSDMVDYHVGCGTQEYPNDPESIDYVDYDLTKIFEENQTDPFFPDRLFANRFVNKFKYLDKGSTQNKIYVFRGPPGSGKSTFLNCLVSKIEEYVNEGPGKLYEVVWKLDDKLTIPCPSHDNPILLVPKIDRPDLFDHILKYYPELRSKVFNDKGYEWLFYTDPCTFCSSMVQSLIDMDKNTIFQNLYVRPYKLNKSLSEGVNIFNSNDEIPKFKSEASNKIQDKLDEYFESQGSDVKYDHSIYAKSNNGIYVLMDLNDNNKERLKRLKGIVSEGKHKVNTIEEQVKSLFLIITNPEDEDSIDDYALQDRKNVTMMNYILVPYTKSKVFKKIYGDYIEDYFHPGVMDCFSRIIISSRMNTGKNPIRHEWVNNPDHYRGICDLDLLILRMEIYAGNIPDWLTDVDKRNFSYDIRKKVIDVGLEDGTFGISDRKAIEMFGDLLQHFKDEDSYISITKVKNYCERINQSITENTPSGFIDSVEKFYMFEVTQQIKESIFQKNTEKIKNDIKNYMYSLNYNIGDTVTVPYTNDTIYISAEFYKEIEKILFGSSNSILRDKVFKKYISESASVADIEETEQFKKLYDSYLYGLKENIIDQFIGNETFRNAILDYESDSFDSYDSKIKRNVNNLIQNMVSKYGYTIKSAKEVCTYILDKA